MVKIFISCFLMLILPAYGSAVQCPSIEEIHLGHFHGWQPLNANSNAVAASRHIEKFIQKIGEFYQAEYFEDGLFNAHCYYSGFQEVYLVGNWQINKLGNKNWHFYTEKWICQSSSVEQCLFG